MVEFRGFKRTVGRNDLESGKFYLVNSYAADLSLIQIIEPSPDVENGVQMCARFGQGDDIIHLEPVPTEDMFLELDEVKIRIDPKSCNGTKFDTNLRCGMLVVHGDNVVILGQGQRGFGWQSFSVSNGAFVNASNLPNWMSFAIWSLVTGPADREKVLVSFQPTESPSNP